MIYAGGWVIALAMNGLYRPRARWSILREAMDVLRATIVLALVTLSVLFVFKMPDVSRLFLLVLFPTQAVVDRRRPRSSSAWRWSTCDGKGKNLRYVLVLGAGPRGQMFAAKLEAHRELGLRVVGFLDDSEAYELPPGWSLLGKLDRLEETLHSRVIDEVAICLPFSQWTLIDTITHVCEEEGKIVRIPMDVLDRAISVGKVEELDGTPVFSLVSGPDRALALAAKRLVDVVVSAVGLVLLSPVLLVIALAIALDDGRPILFRQDRVGLHGRPFRVVKFRSMSRDAEARLAELEHRNEIKGRAFKVTDDPRVTRVGRFLRRTSLDELPQLMERAARRDEPRRAAAAAPRRGGRLRPVAPPAPVDEARHHRPLAGPRPPRAGVRSLGRGRPRVHRPLVALAGRQDPGPDDPGGVRGSMNHATTTWSTRGLLRSGACMSSLTVDIERTPRPLRLCGPSRRRRSAPASDAYTWK